MGILSFFTRLPTPATLSEDVIETKRLRLRAPRPDDVLPLKALCEELPVLLWIPGLKSVLTAEAAGKDNNFIIADKLTDAFKGIVVLSLHAQASVPSSRAQIGMLDYALSRKEWGKGYMTEAVSAACAYGFEHHDMQSIVARVAPRNTRSAATLTRAAFDAAARVPDYIPYVLTPDKGRKPLASVTPLTPHAAKWTFG